MTTYRCVSDRYDRDGGLYTVDEFLEMVGAVFAEQIDLHMVGDEWHDSEGVVLVPDRDGGAL